MGLRLTSPAGRTRFRVEELESRLAPAVTVKFDYSQDAGGFFADPARRAALERAAHSIADRVGDDLAALAPAGNNSWQANVYNPVSGGTILLDNPVIREDELLVFVGGADLPGQQLGLATTGGFSAGGSAGWLEAVRGRGQGGVAAGEPKTDYSTWGGMITFDDRVNWSFGSTAPGADQFDFESVATHELLHVFGFGIGEPAFARHVAGWDGDSGQFVGPTVQALMGGPVGVVGNAGVPDHWASGTQFRGQRSSVEEVIPAGTRRLVTELDLAALKDVGWEVDSFTVKPAPTPVATPAPAAPAVTVTPTPVEPAPVEVAPIATPAPVAPPTPAPVAATARFLVGTPNGAAAVAADGRTVRSHSPFAPGVGAVRVAEADFDHDGRPDAVIGTGPGVGNQVAVADADGRPLASFRPFEGGYTGGVFLATGDLTGDGTADLVVTPDEGGGPVAAVYDGAALAAGSARQVSRFWGIEDSTFRGGARPAVGDLNADGQADLVIAAGAGGGPRVSLYDGKAFAAGQLARLGPDFFAFESGLRNGVYPAVADVDGDGAGDLLAGAGPGGGPRVKAFSGRDLAAGRVTVAADFFAGDATNRGGVRLAVADLDADGRADDVVTATGTTNRVAVYQAAGLGTAGPELSLAVPGAVADGLFVG